MASASTPSLRATSRRHHTRRLSADIQDTPPMELPQRFQGIKEDEEEDYAKTYTDPAVQKQSLYGMIAQASDLDQFNRRWQRGDDSEVEEAGEEESSSTEQETASHNAPGHRKKLLPDTRLLKPRSASMRPETQSEDFMSQSQILPSREQMQNLPQRPASVEPKQEAPVLDRRLRAQAKAERPELASHESTSRRSSQESLSKRKSSAALANVLADIFSLDTPEEVISEYPCWFLQSKLLEGYMYITQKHLCFYAYLQKKSGMILKSSYLAKRGKQNPHYRRYWFVLKGTILTYYSNAAQPYFPSGTIDLSYGISAEVVGEKGTEKETYITITTDTRVYQLRAESLVSAQEWVKQLQKVIFRSHNDGDSVKISLPLDNVVDVEANQVIGSADTIRVRVIDNVSVSGIDEYFFTFYNGGKDVCEVLTTLTKDNAAKKAIRIRAETSNIQGRTSASAAYAGSSTNARTKSDIRDTVKSTLMQADVSSPPALRTSLIEQPNRPGVSRGRSSFEKTKQPLANQATSSVDASKHPDSALRYSMLQTPQSEDDDLSASQILAGDRAFKEPTVRTRPQEKAAARVAASRSSSHSSCGTTTPDKAEKRNNPSPKLSQQSFSHEKSRREHSQSPATASSSDAPPQKTMYANLRPSPAALQSAASLAGFVRDQGKRVSSYLSSSPRDYYGRFSGALAGGRRHYVEADGLATEDRIQDPEDDLEIVEHEKRFRQHFALPESERLVAIFYASLHRVLPLYGKIYLGTTSLCFRSLLYGTRTKIVIPLEDIDNVEKERGFRLGYPGMVLVLRGHEELFFDFRNQGFRNDCVVTILRNIDGLQTTRVDTDQDRADESAAEHKLLQDTRGPETAAYNLEHSDELDLAFDDSSASVLDFKPTTSLRIVCLTIGSRGDVQPYIALCKGLIAEGHRPKIATHIEFGDWVKSHGIDFTPVGGNPAELMRLCVELGMFTPQFIYETNYKFRGWLDELLQTAWQACQGCDLLIESPSAMAGIHIAEALGIPYFRAFTMMWTRTRAYPHAFAAMNYKMGGTYNLTTYGVFDNVFWQMTASQINRWRMRTLKIGPTTSGKMQQNKVPFLYNFSPSFVAPPLDYSDWVRITGYWFLDEGADYKPPDDLLQFIQKARAENMKLVYIGFGSIVVSDSKALTQSIVDAVVKADVRCILSKGWSDRLDAKSANEPEIPLPSSIYKIGAAPHDWLFRQVDAAVHHGGAGTTGASLRAGIPTIIKPFFGDQFFSAARVEDLGVGIRINHISQNVLGKALWIATHDNRMCKKAAALGERIRAEDGVGTAIKAIYRDLEYATTLIKRKGSRPVTAEGESEDEEREDWTFVEADADFDSLGFRKDDPITRHEGAATSRYGGYQLGSLVSRARLH